MGSPRTKIKNLEVHKYDVRKTGSTLLSKQAPMIKVTPHRFCCKDVDTHTVTASCDLGSCSRKDPEITVTTRSRFLGDGRRWCRPQTLKHC